MKVLAVLLLTAALSGWSYGCSEDGTGGFLPENDMQIPVGAKRTGGISEAEFNAVIDKLETIYAPIISSRGGTLRVSRKWKDGTVNASAMRLGPLYLVNMFGGLARHERITSDGFALVMCHEIGHHIGGAPKVANFIQSWASNEGQSDYFATTKCLRQLFLNDNNRAIVSKMQVPRTLSAACTQAFTGRADRDICIRSGMAGASVAGLFAAMRNQPEAKFETPDTNEVARTNDAHPAFQCRLDTYFQGALCEKSHTEDVSQRDEVQGTCHGSTGHTVGVRPRCWHRPKS
jgi:hypothetical protein